MSLAQSEANKLEISKVLNAQEAAWNSGDIDAFMKGYWNSPQLSFTGARGVTKGWNQTLANYKKAYPDKATMGILTFTVTDTRNLGPDSYSMLGKYELQRENDKPHGYFSLIWQRINGQWLITSDHTSAAPVE